MNQVDSKNERKKTVGDAIIEAGFLVPPLIAALAVVLWVLVPPSAVSYVIAAALIVNAFYLQFGLIRR